MSYYSTMHINFEAEKNRKAFIYTVIICALILLLAYFITWKNKLPPPPPLPIDQIEINLGNDKEGYGLEQPLIKGEMSPVAKVTPQQEKVTSAKDESSRDIDADQSDDKESAPVTRPKNPNPNSQEINKESTKPIKTKQVAVVTQPVPKPRNPIATYTGPGNGKGNGADQDNGYKNQGNNPNGTGDYGKPNGNPNTYGTGGLRVIKGDRKIMGRYSFTDDLGAATINAIIKVSPDGRGKFAGFDKGSSKTDPAYATAIAQHLTQMQFDKSDHESVITVQFVFHY